MGRKWFFVLGLVLAVAMSAGAQGVMRTTLPSQAYTRYGRKASSELTIEEQRKLGLSDEQIKKIAEARRDLEKERAKLDEQLVTARAAASAANAEVTRINGEIRTIITLRIRKIHEAVMTPDQLKAWKKQQYVDQAKRYLRSYMRWLKLTDEQVEDIAQLLVPVYEKYDKVQDDLTDAKEQLAELRKADKIDIAAIEKAEKQVGELSKVNVYQERNKELREATRPGLMPDQLEKFDKYGRRR